MPMSYISVLLWQHVWKDNWRNNNLFWWESMAVIPWDSRPYHVINAWGWSIFRLGFSLRIVEAPSQIHCDVCSCGASKSFQVDNWHRRNHWKWGWQESGSQHSCLTQFEHSWAECSDLCSPVSQFWFWHSSDACLTGRGGGGLSTLQLFNVFPREKYIWVSVGNSLTFYPSHFSGYMFILPHFELFLMLGRSAYTCKKLSLWGYDSRVFLIHLLLNKV